MSMLQLVERCAQAGVFLFVEQGKLGFKLSVAQFPPQLKAQVIEHKAELIEFLSSYGRAKVVDSGAISKRPEPFGHCLTSFGQQRLWFVDQLQGNSVQYNMPFAMTVRGTLDLAAANGAIAAVIRRHEVLRTVFYLQDGEVWQQICDDFDFAITEHDLTELPAEQQDKAVQKLVYANQHQVVDLGADLMIQSGFIRKTSEAEGENILLFNIHHIAADGWSMGILLREFCAVYQALVSGQMPALTPMSLQYADFAYWQRQQLVKDKLQPQLDYWAMQLADAPMVHSLPLDWPRPQVRSVQGATIENTLGASVFKSLEALAQQHQVTMFMLFHGALALLLSRHSNSDDIIIGTPVNCRRHPSLEGLIGFFINTLVLRTNTEFDLLADYLAHIKSVNLDAQNNQDVPFEQLVEHCQVPRDLQHTPLFQILLSVDGQAQQTLNLPQLQLEPLKQGRENRQRASKFDLEVSITYDQQGIKVSWLYDTTLFTQATVESLNGDFNRLLGALAQIDGQALNQWSMHTPEELEHFLYGLNDTERNHPKDKTIDQHFDQQAIANPDAIAVIFEQQHLSYRQLAQRVNQLARYLRNQGVGNGTLVGLSLHRSVEMVVAILAVLRAGGAYVACDPQLPASRLVFVIDDSECQMLLCCVAQMDALQSIDSATSVQLLPLDCPEFNAKLRQMSVERLGAESDRSMHSLAYVLYTSGSTGQPKGVMIEHDALLNRIDWMQHQFALTHGDRVLQKTPYGFDVSVWEFLWPLAYGATLVVARPDGHKDPLYLQQLINNEQITIAHFVPSMLKVFVEALNGEWTSSLRLLICSGEALDSNTANTVLGLSDSLQLYNLYGPTEATIDVSFYHCDKPCTAPVVPIGKPIQNTQLLVLDKHLRCSPMGAIGELYIGGVGLARGYLNREMLTAQNFIDHPFVPGYKLYKTGDLVRYLPDGELSFIGRIDSQVKIRGCRIELSEIETHLLAMSEVAHAHVLVFEQQTLVGFVEPVSGVCGSQEWLDGLLQQLSIEVPQYMVPATLVAVTEWPLTANGKVDKKALLTRRFVLRQYFAAPEGVHEQLLAQVWGNLLKRDWHTIDRRDNFFMLGGHSLLLMGYRQQLRESGYDLPVELLYKAQTLAQLAAQLQRGYQIQSAAPAINLADNRQYLTPEMFAMIELDNQTLALVCDKVWGGAENITDIYPLSSLQQGMLYHALLAGEDPYVVKSIIKCDSQAVYQDFLVALQFVIGRHDALRTQIIYEGVEQPFQVVLNEVLVEAVAIDYQGAPEQLEHWLQTYGLDEAQKLCLGPAPLLRLYVVSQGEHFYVLMFNHHLVEDNLSLRLISNEINQHMLGQALDLAPPRQYRDFIWQGLQADKQQGLDYFREHLRGFNTVNAPFAMTGHGDSLSNMTHYQCALPSVLAQRVRALAVQSGVSVASVMHMAWAVVIARVSARQDVVFGSVQSGRFHCLGEPSALVGLCINTLPLRVQLAGTTLQSALVAVHEGLSQLMVYEQTPLSDIQQHCSELGAATPLFNTLLNCRLVHDVAAEKVPGMDVLWSVEHTNYLLSASVDYSDKDIVWTLECVENIGAEKVVDYLFNLLGSMCDAFIADCETDISQLSLFDQAQLSFLLAKSAGAKTAVTTDLLLHQQFEAQVKRNPDNTAVVEQMADGSWQHTSYLRLEQQANRLARYLREQGVGVDTLVGIYCQRNVKAMVAILAVLKAGGAYVPLAYDLPLKRLSYILDDSQVSFVVTEEHLQTSLAFGAFDDNHLTKLVIDSAQMTDKLNRYSSETLVLLPQQSSQNLAYVIYTSGSTGEPKGVLLNHAGVVNMTNFQQGFFALCSASRVLQFASMGFDASVSEWAMAFGTGASLYICPNEDKRNPSSIARLLISNGITHVTLPPAFLACMDETLDYQLQCIVVAGEACSKGVVARWANRYRLINAYGPTEASVCTTATELNANQDIAIGAPIDNVQCYVLDDDRALVPDGAVGELYIGGCGLARGYLNRPKLNAASFVECCFIDGTTRRLYRTGDLVRYLPCEEGEGKLAFIGRRDTQINIRGFRVELGEVQGQLSAHPLVESAAVVVCEDDANNQRIVAYMTAKTQGSLPLSAEDLIGTVRRDLQAMLPDYMVPAVLMVVDQLALTQNGKVDVAQLPPPDLQQLQRRYVPPSSDVELQLVAIWSELLSLDSDDMGIETNFFDIGGHSLLVVRLLAQIKSRFEIEMPIEVIFDEPTIAALAQHIELQQLQTEANDALAQSDNLFELEI